MLILLPSAQIAAMPPLYDIFMKHFNTILASLTILLISCATLKEAEELSFQEKKMGSVDKDLSKILLAGIGSTATRIFLEKLSIQMIEKFKQVNLKIEYQYFGTDGKVASNKLKSLEKTDYDGLLIFSPTDTAYFSGVTTIDNQMGGTNFTRVRTSSEYHQHFDVWLYKSPDKPILIWKASLDVSTNLAKPGIYEIISDKIYKYFELNNFIP